MYIDELIKDIDSIVEGDNYAIQVYRNDCGELCYFIDDLD